jgi:hypothetical protein
MFRHLIDYELSRPIGTSLLALLLGALSVAAVDPLLRHDNLAPANSEPAVDQRSFGFFEDSFQKVAQAEARQRVIREQIRREIERASMCLQDRRNFDGPPEFWACP